MKHGAELDCALLCGLLALGSCCLLFPFRLRRDGSVGSLGAREARCCVVLALFAVVKRVFFWKIELCTKRGKTVSVKGMLLA